MSTQDASIREIRQNGDVAIVPRRYSPDWWNQDRTKPSALRIMASKWKPQMCVIHEHGGPIQFLAFGGIDGMNVFLDEYLGPIVKRVA